MENKYEVIGVDIINEDTTLFSVVNLDTKEDYSCILEKQPKGRVRVLADDLANIFDIGEALFQYDLDFYPSLPLNMITPDMSRDYENYYPGKANCMYKTDEDYFKVYNEEEERIKNLRKKIKQLVK